jgi:FkbH-like protein
MILGDNPFGVRWQLLTQPAFQVPHVTDESRRRSEMVRGQLERERTRVIAPDPDAFVASLEMRCTIRRERDERNLARIVELVHRTTQLNTTGEQPTPAELRSCALYTLAAADRFADYGLVGVCITDGAVIRQLVLSCRVIGLGLERVLVRAAAADAAQRTSASVVEARLIATPRNQSARHVFASCGFSRDADDPARWSIAASALDVPEPPPYAVTRVGFD